MNEVAGHDWRRKLIATHQDNLVGMMLRTGYSDPVGIIADLEDFYAREMAHHVGRLSTEEIERMRQAERVQGKAATMLLVVTLEQAKVVMPCTSPTALTKLSMPRQPGYRFIIAMGRGANTYALVDLGKYVCSDGNHRVTGL
jgi:hypothetical protein